MVRPTNEHALTVAGWSRSAREAELWCSRAEHPFPAEAIQGWWERPDVTPWVLLDPTGIPSAYGEIWDDEEEDETELARVIVDPDRRRAGLGRRLIEQLVAQARSHGRSACFIRVHPDNDGALALYRSIEFRDVDVARAAEWNHGQPADYRWLEHVGSVAVARDRRSG